VNRQRWNPERYREDAGFVPVLGQPAVELLDPQPGERILDLGCGDGALTGDLVARGAEVVAIDASPEMVVAARARGFDARLADGQALAFAGEFDAVFSNAALHWMTAPDAVLTGVRRALRPGGRFVGEFGGVGNVQAVIDAMTATFANHPEFGVLRLPWYFPTPEAYRKRLMAGGFRVVTLGLHPRPTPLPGDLAAWLAIFADAITSHLDTEQKRCFTEETTVHAATKLHDVQAGWQVDYVRLRFAAVLCD
jgi:SAM-dependent methyltransferase